MAPATIANHTTELTPPPAAVFTRSCRAGTWQTHSWVNNMGTAAYAAGPNRSSKIRSSTSASSRPEELGHCVVAVSAYGSSTDFGTGWNPFQGENLALGLPANLTFFSFAILALLGIEQPEQGAEELEAEARVAERPDRSRVGEAPMPPLREVVRSSPSAWMSA